MSVKEKAKHIIAELKGHVPFTLFGALLGIFFMLVFRRVSGVGSRTLFAVFHPAHVILSAMVTASMFKLHAAKRHFVLVLVVGYFGSAGIATLSDIVIPHFGTRVLGLHLPAHPEIYHEEAGSEEAEHDHDEQLRGEEDGHFEHHIHLGFIKEWYLVDPAALLGSRRPQTAEQIGEKLPAPWRKPGYHISHAGDAAGSGACAQGVFGREDVAFRAG